MHVRWIAVLALVMGGAAGTLMSGGHPRLTGYVSVPRSAATSPSPAVPSPSAPPDSAAYAGSDSGQDDNMSAVIPSIPGVNAPEN